MTGKPKQGVQNRQTVFRARRFAPSIFGEVRPTWLSAPPQDPAFGALPGFGTVRGCRPPLWPQKNHAAGGAVWRKEQNGKNPHRFSPLFYHSRTVFVKRSARKRSSETAHVVKGSLRKRRRCLSEFPLFRPLFQKKFLLHAFRELPTAKGGGGPGQSAAFQKADFLRPAHDKLHFAR